MAQTVGEYIAEDWTQNCHENTQADLEDAVRDLALRLAIQFEVAHGDDAVLSLAEVLREAADFIEKRTGVFIQRDRKRARQAV